jgi:hypothetical protein
VARALLLDVKLLIADEIISMLDASTRVDVLNMLVALKRKGLAVLFITHDLSLGNYISDRTVILRYGAVVEMGDTEKVFGHPQHPYTRHLLTAVPQLHRRWQAADAERNAADGLGAGGAKGSGAGMTGAQVSTFGADASSGGGQSQRYSKSGLHPRKAGPPPVPTGPRPSLMELEDQPWRSRFRVRGGPSVATVLANNAPPALVQFEPGHFVAVEE